MMLLTAVSILIGGSIALAAPPDMIPPEELYRGMKGYGKTVIAGTKIETFSVEVIGVMQNSGATGGDLILVKLSGDVIERAGGVAQGMSGSPVFFNGRLAGAVAFGWTLSQPDICMLTPIGEMLKISEDMRTDLAEKSRQNEELRRQIDRENALELAKIFKGDKDKSNDEDITVENDTDEKKQIIGKEIAQTENMEQSELGALFPKGTPVMAVGFSERGLEMVKSNLKSFDIIPYAVGNSPYSLSDVALEPGSAVSVELIRGDVSLGVLGTVTWVDGDEVLAFGHPFTKRGKVNYFLSNAYTFTTVSSINSSFKVGAPGKLLGVTLQDRGSGIAGKIGLYPEIVPMLITVSDKGRGINKVSTVQILQDDILSPYLAQAAVVSLVDRAIDRKGEGTGKVDFTIRAQGMPDEKEIKRSNMFYSASNVSEILAGEMAQGMYLLKRNRFKSLVVTDVHINIEVSDRRDTATILSAKSLLNVAKPGDSIAIEVTLQPYQGANRTKMVYFTVPKDQPVGPMYLMVRGGTSLVTLQNIVNQQVATEKTVLLREDTSKFKNFADEIDEFNKKDRNNDIVVDIFPGIDNGAKKKKNDVLQRVQEQEKQLNEFVQGTNNKTNMQTNYIVTGETSIVVGIVIPEEE